MSKNELEQVIKNASLKIGVNEVILEKDYWVCFVLNYLFSKCKWKEAFTFKGGTSLSKCFNLIHRFSEDIDLILICNDLLSSVNHRKSPQTFI